MHDATSNTEDKKKAMAWYAADLSRSVAEYAALVEARASDKPGGPATGIPALDEALGGWLRPAIYTLTGGTGVGKSALALQVAAYCGCPAVYLTMEMPLGDCRDRLISLTQHRDIDQIRKGLVPYAEMIERVERLHADHPDLLILDAMARPRKAEGLAEVVAAVKADSRHGLLVVDSLHTWCRYHAPGTLTDMHSKINWGMESLGKLVADHGVAVLILAERNRATVKEASLSGAADSRQIEYASAVVMGLDWFGLEQGDERVPLAAFGVAEFGGGERHVYRRKLKLELLKNRYGTRRAFENLEFYGAFQRTIAVPEATPEAMAEAFVTGEAYDLKVGEAILRRGSAAKEQAAPAGRARVRR